MAEVNASFQYIVALTSSPFLPGGPGGPREPTAPCNEMTEGKISF